MISLLQQVTNHSTSSKAMNSWGCASCQSQALHPSSNPKNQPITGSPLSERRRDSTISAEPGANPECQTLLTNWYVKCPIVHSPREMMCVFSPDVFSFGQLWETAFWWHTGQAIVPFCLWYTKIIEFWINDLQTSAGFVSLKMIDLSLWTRSSGRDAALFLESNL